MLTARHSLVAPLQGNIIHGFGHPNLGAAGFVTGGNIKKIFFESNVKHSPFGALRFAINLGRVSTWRKKRQEFGLRVMKLKNMPEQDLEKPIAKSN